MIARFGNSVSLSEDGNTALIGGPADNGGVGAAWIFTYGSSSTKPVITGVVNGASFLPGPIVPGSWVAIFGTGLAPAGTSRKWNESTEIINGVLPTSLDGTSVLVNGRPAVVEFIASSEESVGEFEGGRALKTSRGHWWTTLSVIVGTSLDKLFFS
jgi:hypothetical protein